MKQSAVWIFACIYFIGTIAAQAQDNVFYDQAFWKKNPDVTLVKAEIEKDNSPTQLNRNGFDAVVMAINNAAPIETILFLLSIKGNEVNKITHDSRIYLHWAASRGNIEIMEHLLKLGSKTDVEDSHGYTPLNFAAANGQKNTKVYDLCLAHGADLQKEVNHDGANALLLAIGQDNDFTLTNYFISKGLDLNSKDANGNTAFNYAARSGNLAQMKRLQQKGVSFTDQALLMAAQGGRGSTTGTEIFEYLLSLGISPKTTNSKGDNVLHFLVRKPNQADNIRYFLSKDLNINETNKEGNSAFMIAAANGTPETLTQLLPLVKNINQANAKGVTALGLAVRSNTVPVVKILLDNGADVSMQDKEGDNLTAYLIQSYNPTRGGINELEQRYALLEAKGLNVAKVQGNGNTLYHLAIAKEDLPLLKWVANKGADINHKNKEGLTVLHKAAMTAKNDEILRYLIAAGASKKELTEYMETPFDLASENEYLAKQNISIDFLK